MNKSTQIAIFYIHKADLCGRKNFYDTSRVDEIINFYHTKTLFSSQLSTDVQLECKIDIAKDIGKPPPLFIHPGTSEFFHPTDRSGILTIVKSQQMELFCTNGFSSPRGIARDLVSVSCAHGSKFQLNGSLYNLNEFACRKYPFHTAQRRLGARCFNDSSLIDVGFRVDKRRFLQTMTLCHNPATEQTYYAKYQLTPASVAAQQGFNRPKFIQGEFFPGKDINFLYSRDQQRETISTIVKSDEWAAKLVQERGDVFLSRGEVACLREINGNFNNKKASAFARFIAFNQVI